MSNDTKILSIEIENYRQYYDKQKIDFSSREEGFTIIAGKNGEGKSNLLNAISWCLFHDEPHGVGEDDPEHRSDNKSLSVINNRYITETKKETTATTRVKIWIQDGADTYVVSRKLSVLKHELKHKVLANGKKEILLTQFGLDRVPQGCEIFEELGGFVVMKKGSTDADFHDTITEVDPRVKVEELLPRELSKYYLLDGEFLEGFWQKTSVIKAGVEQISQLNLLSSLEKHVAQILPSTSGAGQETDSFTSKIQTFLWIEQSLDDDGNESFSQLLRWKENPNEVDRYYHATGQPRIKDIEEDLNRMQDRLKAISGLIRNNTIPNVKRLKIEYDRTKGFLDDEKERLDKYTRKYNYNLVNKSPYIFLKKSIGEAVNIIQKRMELGDLPVKHRRDMVNGLLERGNCICGDDKLTENQRKSITDYRDALTGRDDLDAAIDLKIDFKEDFIDRYDTFLKLNFGDPRTDFTKSEEAYEKLNIELKGISTELGASGDDETEKLIQEHEYIIEQRDKLHAAKESIVVELAANNKSRGEYKIKLKKALKKNVAAKIISHELDIWDKIYVHVHQTYEKLNDKIRIDVQNTTWKNFKELIADPTQFESFSIESDYSVHMLDTHNFNQIRNLSKGQSLLLTLSFVAALREPTGYRFPLIVDSPLGKIDGPNRYYIGKRLPDYLPGEQLSLLVTDTEYTAYIPPDDDHPEIPPETTIPKIFEEKIKLTHWKIQKEKTGKNVGNSTLKSAKLVFDKQKKGWKLDVV